MPSQEELMRAAGENSLEYIPESAKIAVFGAGRTVCQALQAFFDKGMHKGRVVVCGSAGTEQFAQDLGIETGSPTELIEEYVYIDGADQIDPARNLIKGGFKGTGDPGIEGCMAREKRLAKRAKTFIVIADASKVVKRLGENAYQFPVEFAEKNRRIVEKELKGLNLNDFSLRPKPDNTPFITENHNQILDVTLPESVDLVNLEKKVEKVEAIFATGLFVLRKPDVIIIASDAGIELLE